MRAMFLQKLHNFFDRFHNCIPESVVQDIDPNDFDKAFAALATWVTPLDRHIRAHDMEFLAQLVQSAVSREVFDVYQTYEETMNDQQREWLWQYLEWFLDWYKEYTQ